MDFKESFELIEKWYTEIKKEYKELYPKMKTPEERKTFLEKFKKTVEEMQHEVDCINAEVVFLDAETAQKDVYNQIRIYEMYIEELEGTVNRELYKKNNFNYDVFDDVKKRQKDMLALDLKDKKSKDVKKFKMTGVEHGNALYQEAKDKLTRIKKNIKESSDKLAVINEEIRQQNYKLLEIDDLIKESQSLFVRVKEMIAFFTKTFYKQKCMSLMCGLMFVLCIACILLIFLEKSKGGEAPVADTTTATTPTPTA